jgi:hypothetical protein
MLKFTIIIEDSNMDSGCLHNILQECVNHGKVVEAFLESTHIHTGQKEVIDQMYVLEYITPQEGKC